MANPKAIFTATTTPGAGNVSSTGQLTPDEWGLWITDGTPAGTSEYYPASGTGGVSGNGPIGPSDFQASGSRIFFVASGDLWQTDGTAAGTRVVAPLEAPISAAQQSSPQYSVAFGGTRAIYVGANEQIDSSDGTTAVTLTSVTGGLGASGFTPLDGLVLFQAALLNGATLARTLWVSDGTSAGTHALAVPGANADFDPRAFTVLGSHAFFIGRDATGTYCVWITDGTASGTRKVTDAAGDELTLPGFSSLRVIADRVYFAATPVGGALSLYVSDGTQTVALDGPAQTPDAAFRNLAVFTTGINNVPSIGDGTQAGTHPVPAPAGGGSLDGSFEYLTFGKKLLFTTGDGELISTDGKTSTTLETESPGAAPAAAPRDTPVLWLDQHAIINQQFGVSDQFGGTEQNDVEATDGVPDHLTALVPPGNPHANSLAGDFLASGFTELGHMLYGPLGGRSTIQGTADDDVITAYGASNTINGKGGQDRITGGDGGYNHVVVGSSGDNQTSLAENVLLFGRGNTVTGGDESFAIAGGEGFSTITLGNGADDVRLHGTYNAVTVGAGSNFIDAGGAHSTVSINGFGTPGPNTVLISGTGDSVSESVFSGHLPASSALTIRGGQGSSRFTIYGATVDLATDGTYNVISIGLGGGKIVAGSGYDKIIMSGPESAAGAQAQPVDYQVVLGGSHNVVQGAPSRLSLNGGSGSSTFVLDAGAPFGSTASISITTSGEYNAFKLSDTATNVIVAGGDGSRVAIGTPPPFPGAPSTPSPLAASTVTFAGINNLLTATDAPVTVTGGTGNGTFTLGNGDDAITTGGSNNKITLGTGHSTVNPGSDHDIVVLNGSNAALTLAGGGQKVFLNAGASGSIAGGAAPDLHVYVAPGIGAETIAGILADPRAIVDLKGGAGGYATAAQAYAALTPDGHGGSLLAVGSGSLDFLAAAPSTLSANLFAIG